MKSNFFLKQLLEEIDHYLVVLPNTARYSEYEEKEAIDILNYVIEVFKKNKMPFKDASKITVELEQDLKYIDHCKGLTTTAKDAHFAWVINKIQYDLKQIRKAQSQSS